MSVAIVVSKVDCIFGDYNSKSDVGQVWNIMGCVSVDVVEYHMSIWHLCVCSGLFVLSRKNVFLDVYQLALLDRFL